MRSYFYCLVVALSCFSCEDVVDVDLATDPPRLVVDALIRVDSSKPSTMATVKVGLTSSFFSNNTTAAPELITIENLDYIPDGDFDTAILVLSAVAPGMYQNTASTRFFTTGTLELNIRYNKQTYTAQTVYAPTTPINSISQGDGTLFSDVETEIIVSFFDNPEQDNYYIFDFDFDEYLITDDAFYQGQNFEFSYFYDDTMNIGNTVTIGVLGATKSFYNYMDELIVQAGGNQGPFQTPVATVRGNIVNVTPQEGTSATEDFALGYFAVVQEFRTEFTIQ